MRTKHRKRTILLALTSTHHGFYRGAARYAAEHDWHVVADMIYDATIPVGWKGDGILSFVGHWDDLAKYVLSAGIPVVEISSVRKDLGIPCVIEDNEAIGRLGPIWARRPSIPSPASCRRHSSPLYQGQSLRKSLTPTRR